MNETIDTVLTSDKVHETFLSCLYKDGEDTSKHIAVQGIVVNIGFHPERLEAQRETVRKMLDELPEPFHEKAGGGWTFLNMCNDKDNRQWTGMHAVMEELCLLGIGLDMATFPMPREMWSILPGNVPYFMVKAPKDN